MHAALNNLILSRSGSVLVVLRAVNNGFSLLNALQASAILLLMSLSVDPTYEPGYLKSSTILMGLPST